jgi:hypothetical protein
VHPAARRALNEILAAEDRSHAERAIQAFAAAFGVKWPKAVAKVTDDADSLLTFYDYPAEHWLHLRTTDERFKAVWRCWPAGTGLASSVSVVDPGAKSRVVGLGALPRSLLLRA